MNEDQLEIGVIIPTFNRGNVVQRCLEALTTQTFAAECYEIIVSDDGSEDDTAEVTARWAAQKTHRIRYLRQVNRGANAARNHGVRESRGRILLFINDDTIAVPTMLAEHYRIHCRYPEEEVAVLGRMTYSPELPPNLFARLHLDANYALWAGKEELDWRAFYTCNVSVKKSLLLKYGMFEERMRYHEDLELSERLSRHGLRLIYNPDALGYHYHFLQESEYLRVAKREGKALAVWYEISPQLGRELAEIGFHPTAGPLRKLKLFCGDLLCNRLTRPLFLAGARFFASRNEDLACRLYTKLFQSLKREGVREELRRLQQRHDRAS